MHPERLPVEVDCDLANSNPQSVVAVEAVRVNSRGPLHEVLQHVPAAIYRCDAHGRITYFNAAAAQLWGREPILGQDLWCGSWRIFRPDGLPMALNQCPMAVALREGKPVRGVEIFVERPDGTRVHVMPYPEPIFDHKGKVAGAVNLLVDITAQRQNEARLCAENEAAQRALREREQHLQSIIESTSECIKTVALDGTLLQMNPAGLAMVEADSAETVLGHSVFPIIAPEHREAFEAMHARVCAGAREHLEFEVVGLKGTRRWMETYAHPIRDPRTGQTVQLAVTRDITTRKRTDAAVHHLAAIVESSDDAIISKNLQGFLTSWNRGAENIFGYTAQEAIGQHVTLLIPRERLAEEDLIIGKIRAGQRVEHYETIRRRKDGRLINVSLTVSPVKDSEGRITGASKIARDITVRKQIEEALRESQQKLAEANAALDEKVRERTASLERALAQMEEFSYSVSHDLRAPLRAIEAYSQFLSEDHAAALDTEGQDYLAKIARNIHRMNRLISDVLALSRLARTEVKLRDIQLQPLLGEIIEQNHQLQPPSVEMEVRVVHAVVGDEVSLAQAITNLLNNAVKFVRPGVKPQVRVWSEARGTEVRLWIEDNGIGIPADQVDKLFGMFQRLSTPHRYEGTGIGLAIVRKAVERMGGTVGVESDGSSGSRFWIQLKAASA